MVRFQKRVYAKFLTFVTLILVAQAVLAEQPPVVPLIDPAMKAQLRKIYKNGLSTGNRAAVFAKVGDSVTRNAFFLKDIGCGIEVLANHEHLAPTIRYFRGIGFPDSYTTAWCGEANSFSRDSYASSNGWTANDPLKRFSNPASECPPPHDNPLRCEIHLVKPSIALIMFGTNDVEKNDPALFRSRLTRVVQETIVDGVVPVISTIPPRLDNETIGARVPQYNQIIQEIAETLQVPLWNYWFSLQTAINYGVDNRGIHPSVLNGSESAVFTSEGLRYGFNLRNFTALEVLKKVKAVVLSNGPPDSNPLPNFSIFPTSKLPPIERGTELTFKIKIQRNHFPDPVTFSLKGRPKGVSASLKPGNSPAYEIVTLNVSSDAVPGDYRITVYGTAKNLKRTTTFALTIKN